MSPLHAGGKNSCIIHCELHPTSRTHRGKDTEEGRRTVFFTPLDPFGDDTEEFNNDFSKPGKCTVSEMEGFSRKAQEKGLQF